ncbi:xylose isomerase-like protein [Dipodascopsis tothii]|uniref:xylose isomerase-like protein n=1 Tax=Dipodascopsis tothii TaxID=44089 RepID=UPI0034CD5FE8
MPPRAAASAAKRTRTSASTAKTPAKTKDAGAKDEPPETAAPMFARTPQIKMLVGAHVPSDGKGVSNCIANTVSIGGNAFALFVKSQRRWVAPPLKTEEITKFKDMAAEHKYDLHKHCLPHGSYLINLANADDEKHEKALASFLDELKRCEQLGIGLYNFHPGSTLGLDKKAALERLAGSINSAISQTKFIKIILENMAGHGNLIGSTWEDLRDVIAMVDNKDRVGVCVDTCHTFAAGYDIRTEETFAKVWDDFDRIIGLKYLSSMHLNDSKAPLGSNRDLHQNIGLGFLGLESFRVLMNTKHLEGLPLILETPDKDDIMTWAKEIKLLEWLVGKKADDPEVVKKTAELSALGAKERASEQDKMDKKAVKADKKKQSTLVGKKRKAESDE